VASVRIAQLVPECPWGEMLPDLLQQGVGGRETCALKLSEAWAEAGHHVDNYVPVEKPRQFESQSGGVQRFAPYELGLLNLQVFPYDMVVVVEDPRPFADDGVREAQVGAVKLCHFQVAHVDEERLAHREPDDFVISALSPWHVDFLASQGLTGESVVNPNGVSMDLYRDAASARQRGPRFHYTSSPDRGLDHLLDVWPLVRAEIPKAELVIAYGLERVLAAYRYSHNREGEMASRVRSLLQTPGVVYVGKVGQSDLAQLHMTSTALLYPCDTMQPTETGCITVIEAMAAHAAVVTTDCDCLGSEFADSALMHELPVDPQQFAASAVALYFDDALRDLYVERGAEKVKTRDWKDIAEGWIAFAQERLSSRALSSTSSRA
jgi:glycosyltransferase involved in cell wall biosynthesis